MTAQETSSRGWEIPVLVVGLVGTLVGFLGAALWSASIEAWWFGPAERAMVVGAVLAAAAGVFALVGNRLGLRIGLSALAGLMPGAYWIAEQSGHGLAYATWEDPRIGLLAAVVCSLGALGLVLRRAWARWLALAAAFGGLGTAGLNLIPTLAAPTAVTWTLTLELCMSAFVGVLLAGPAVRAAFETEGPDGIWSSPEPAVRTLRRAILAQLVALPMLLVYAWVQPIVPETRGFALVLAGLLGLAALLSMGRKLAGALLSAVVGPALVVLTGLSAWLALGHDDPLHLRIVGYYACFWIPAGLLSMAAARSLIKPVRQLWAQL